MSAFRGTGSTVVGGAPVLAKSGVVYGRDSRIDREKKMREELASGGVGGAADLSKVAPYGSGKVAARLGRGPDQSLVPAPTDPGAIARADKAGQTALSRIENENRMRVRGRASTMLTGTRGLMGSPSVARRVLMGA